MAEIKPLRGIRYDDQKFAGELGDLLAPPYDVIDDAEQAALYAKHPNNVVRLDLNQIRPEDHAEDNRYTRSRRHLMDWLAQGVLKVESDAALYVHDQEFDDGKGGRALRRGFIGRVRLAEYDEKIVLPHERTLRGPKVDRLELMKATEANLSQVFLLYSDPERAVDAALDAARGDEPAIDVTTPDGIRHRLWPVTDAAAISTVEAFFTDEALLIADGHHRYETALAYRDFRRGLAETGGPDAPYEFVTSFFVNMNDPGLLVFPTHRVLHSVEGFDAAALIATLTAHADFDVRAWDAPVGDGGAILTELEGLGEEAPSFALLVPGQEGATIVRFVGGTDSEVFDAETPEEVRALDVAVLHEGIIDRLVGVDKAAQEAKTNLRYKKKLPEAITEWSETEGVQLVVLMNATPVEQVDRVCRGGGKMPQKSTYCYPKILSGLVIGAL